MLFEDKDSTSVVSRPQDCFSNLPHTAQTPILDALPIKDVINLQQVSSTCKEYLRGYRRVTFDDKQLYGQFFDKQEHIISFRKKQAECRALVSGSALALMLGRSPHKPHDLDIFTPMIYVDNMEAFIGTTGYKRADNEECTSQQATERTRNAETLSDDTLEELDAEDNTEDVAEYNQHAVETVLTFQHDNGQRLQIIGTKVEPIDAILGFYSTLVMNVATATKVISLYPYTSFVEQKAVYLKNGRPRP
ncbi:hypothetical protein VNI00_017100 [Paramarasmius palmivorus]|uniref:F-box domain-containing protein n=1 Tax=Paramarasmius palmivorus TaxID=297713 RepID=A0AAW0B851_9AGAR